MHKVTHLRLNDINSLLMCSLCSGYLIDATTVVECLHSFCRTCIVNYLKLHNTCPNCDTMLHKTKPHHAIRPDRVLQALVYKLVPNLFVKEMNKRKGYYVDHPGRRERSLSPERCGDITLNHYVLQEEERFSVELTYWQPDCPLPISLNGGTSPRTGTETIPSDCYSTYLLCPPDLTVGNLEKLIRVKYDLRPDRHEVAVFFSSDDCFSSDYTLSDLACLYTWRRQYPMRLYFSIADTSQADASFTSLVPAALVLPLTSTTGLTKMNDNHHQTFPTNGCGNSTADNNFASFNRCSPSQRLGSTAKMTGICHEKSIRASTPSKTLHLHHTNNANSRINSPVDTILSKIPSHNKVAASLTVKLKTPTNPGCASGVLNNGTALTGAGLNSMPSVVSHSENASRSDNRHSAFALSKLNHKLCSGADTVIKIETSTESNRTTTKLVEAQNSYVH